MSQVSLFIQWCASLCACTAVRQVYYLPLCMDPLSDPPLAAKTLCAVQVRGTASGLYMIPMLIGPVSIKRPFSPSIYSALDPQHSGCPECWPQPVFFRPAAPCGGEHQLGFPSILHNTTPNFSSPGQGLHTSALHCTQLIPSHLFACGCACMRCIFEQGSFVHGITRSIHNSTPPHHHHHDHDASVPCVAWEGSTFGAHHASQHQAPCWDCTLMPRTWHAVHDAHCMARCQHSTAPRPQHSTKHHSSVQG